MSYFLPTQNISYTWFYYFGILFFVTHIALYGFSINLSYFGMILIYIGLKKPILSSWFKNILWIFIAFDLYANFNILKKKMENKNMVTFNKKIKEGVKAKNNNDDDNEDNNEDDNRKITIKIPLKNKK